MEPLRKTGASLDLGAGQGSLQKFRVQFPKRAMTMLRPHKVRIAWGFAKTVVAMLAFTDHGMQTHPTKGQQDE